MRHYEILLLIHPDQSNQVPAMVERYRTIVIKNNGKIHRQEDWGRQQLAYQINNRIHKAHYILFNLECDKNTLIELENAFKFNDAVIRSLITKCDCAITEPSIFFKTRDNDKNTKDSNYYQQNNSSSYINKDSSEIDNVDLNFTDPAAV